MKPSSVIICHPRHPRPVLPNDLGLHCKFHEMIHEHLERHVVRKNGLHPSRLDLVVCDGRIQLRHEKARLALVLVTHDVPGMFEENNQPN